jgi:hypothetical protein
MGGSELSWMSRDIVDLLRVKCKVKEMTITTLNSTITRQTPECRVTISSLSGDYKLNESTFIVANQLPTTSCVIPGYLELRNYSHLKGIRIHKLKEPANVTIRIGVNEPSAHAPDMVRRGSRFQPQGL